MGAKNAFLILDVIISFDLSDLNGSSGHENGNISALTHHVTPT
jgi:hypothetical protein